MRDTLPDRFLDAHRALFAHRHEQAGSLRDEQALRNVLQALDIDADAVFAEVASGRPLATIKAEHTALRRPATTCGACRRSSSTTRRRSSASCTDPRVTARSPAGRSSGSSTCCGWPDLNEFKHTSIPH